MQEIVGEGKMGSERGKGSWTAPGTWEGNLLIWMEISEISLHLVLVDGTFRRAVTVDSKNFTIQ